MKKKFLILIIIFLYLLTIKPKILLAEEAYGKPFTVHHDVKVILYPEQSRIRVKDSITLDKHFSELRFFIHEGLEITSSTPGVEILRCGEEKKDVSALSYKVKLSPGINSFDIDYSGIIYNPLKLFGREHARSFKHTQGIISKDGVYLEGGSFWYPHFGEEILTFTLQAELPQGWDAVSQGKRTIHEKKETLSIVKWESPEPQEEIFLIASKFVEYSKISGNLLAMVFLRSPDPSLANKYLDATLKYITMYENLIGPYPYKKFALVENFWESGLGMPSFTLLGSRIIRFPFIIDSSYPHEILHNWWGNSVFPDNSTGNWSEGLTAYLSDHLIKEQQGKGTEYRQTTLQKYADFVSQERDFPLTEFRMRHSSPSEAIGYGKSLMFFHMLRRQLGDRTFIAGVRQFYTAYKFKTASFDDLRKIFEEVSGKNLKNMFFQWIEKAGAPELKISDIDTYQEGEDFILNIIIEQIQSGDAYAIDLPLAITMENDEFVYQTVAHIDKKRSKISLRLQSKPLRVDVDPEFDVFRRLKREETPPALSQVLGARKIIIIIPSSAEDSFVNAYEELARAISASGPDKVQIKSDRDFREIPSDSSVVILGWENRFFKEIQDALSGYDISINEKNVKICETEIPKKNHSFMFSGRTPENKDMSIVFIASTLKEAIKGLGSKLPHYHKYSYLAFEGEEPVNICKGRWSVIDSPMTLYISEYIADNGSIVKADMGKLAKRSPLVSIPNEFSKDRLMETIRFLSSDELEGRGLKTKGLDRAAAFIAKKFKDAGLMPGGNQEESYFQTWKDPEYKMTMKNVIGIIPGRNREFSQQSIVIGAHYDHIGFGWPDVKEGNRGKIHPGADDNASGVAILTELAEILGRTLNPERTVIFVAFTGEEADKKGSKYYVNNQKSYPVEQCVGMLNLDTVGRLGKKNLLILGGSSAKEWVHILRGACAVTGVDIEMVAEDLDSSDQKSFHEKGVPAIQLFTGPHPDYHRPSDTAEKIDSEGLLKIASVVKEVIEYLSQGRNSLTSTINEQGNSSVSLEHKKRKSSLGIIPDFEYKDKGCRLSGVVPGSPAEIQGMKEADIIIRLNSHNIKNLKDLSEILKTLNPGEKVSITLIRDGKKMTISAELECR